MTSDSIRITCRELLKENREVEREAGKILDKMKNTLTVPGMGTHLQGHHNFNGALIDFARLPIFSKSWWLEEG